MRGPPLVEQRQATGSSVAMVTSAPWLIGLSRNFLIKFFLLNLNCMWWLGSVTSPDSPVLLLSYVNPK